MKNYHPALQACAVEAGISTSSPSPLGLEGKKVGGLRRMHINGDADNLCWSKVLVPSFVHNMNALFLVYLLKIQNVALFFSCDCHQCWNLVPTLGTDSIPMQHLFHSHESKSKHKSSDMIAVSRYVCIELTSHLFAESIVHKKKNIILAFRSWMPQQVHHNTLQKMNAEAAAPQYSPGHECCHS